MTARKAPAKRAAAPAAAARQAEALDGYVTVEQCGVTLKIPVGSKVPLRATLRFMGLNDDLTPLAANENRNLLGASLLLGVQQWNAFLEKDPAVDDFEALVDQLQELSGN